MGSIPRAAGTPKPEPAATRRARRISRKPPGAGLPRRAAARKSRLMRRKTEAITTSINPSYRVEASRNAVAAIGRRFARAADCIRRAHCSKNTIIRTRNSTCSIPPAAKGASGNPTTSTASSAACAAGDAITGRIARYARTSSTSARTALRIHGHSALAPSKRKTGASTIGQSRVPKANVNSPGMTSHANLSARFFATARR
jgi:hypothetical protein